MAYEIVMPQLSDSMDEGKLISWKVKEGDRVHKGDVVAEIESDKAIMEVQSFKEGVVEHINIKEGDTVSVGTVIATIDTQADESDAAVTPTKKIQKVTKPKSIPSSKHKPCATVQPKKEPKEPPTLHSYLDEILGMQEEESLPAKVAVQGDASPKAKALAAKYQIDITALQKRQKLPTPAHEEDVLRYHRTHYFTPKALALLDLYRLDPSAFTEDQKYDSDAILSYIQAHDIVLPQKIDTFQSALITAVESSAKKPVFHIYDSIDAALLQKDTKHTMTVGLIKLFSQALIQHEQFRSRLQNDTIVITPNASLSVAISHEAYLYMPVLKDANLLAVDEIQSQLHSYEQKAQTKSMRAEDMQGATFGISNLGMLGIERFDAMINKEESGIAAIGAMIDGKINITLTLDHRLINGYQGAQFMQTLKALALDAHFFKDI